MAAQALGHMLDDGAHLAALGGARRAQDRRHRRAARHVIAVLCARRQARADQASALRPIPTTPSTCSASFASALRTPRGRPESWGGGTSCVWLSDVSRLKSAPDIRRPTASCLTSNSSPLRACGNGSLAEPLLSYVAFYGRPSLPLLVPVTQAATAKADLLIRGEQDANAEETRVQVC